MYGDSIGQGRSTRKPCSRAGKIVVVELKAVELAPRFILSHKLHSSPAYLFLFLLQVRGPGVRTCGGRAAQNPPVRHFLLKQQMPVRLLIGRKLLREIELFALFALSVALRDGVQDAPRPLDSAALAGGVSATTLWQSGAGAAMGGGAGRRHFCGYRGFGTMAASRVWRSSAGKDERRCCI